MYGGSRHAWGPFFPEKFRLSPHDLINAFQTLDMRDSPNAPGFIKLQSLKSALARFRLALGISVSEVWAERQESFVSPEESDDLMVQWNDPKILNLFEAKLNVHERFFFVLEPNSSSTRLSRLVPTFFMAVVILSITSWLFSTVSYFQVTPADCDRTSLQIGSCEPVGPEFFDTIELLCLIIFAAEYFARLLTCHSVRFLTHSITSIVTMISTDESVQPSTHSSNFIGFIMNPNYLVDLAALIPSIISYSVDSSIHGFQIIRILRLSRVFRVFKIAAYNDTFLLFTRVMKNSIASLLLMLIFIFTGLILFGAFVWEFENGDWYPQGHPTLIALGVSDRGAYVRADDTNFGYDLSPFTSIPATFWYVMATMTTVGYGDVVPTTYVGRAVGGLCMLTGIFAIALPVGVLGSNFTAELEKINSRKMRYKQMKKRLRESTMIGQKTRLAIHDIDDSSAIDRVKQLLANFPRNSPGLDAFARHIEKHAIKLIESSTIPAKDFDHFLTSSSALIDVFVTTDTRGMQGDGILARRQLLTLTQAILDVGSSN